MIAREVAHGSQDTSPPRGRAAHTGELGAVDGEDAVAEPEGSGLVGAAQDLGMEALEDVLVNARPGLAHGGVGDRPLLGQGHVQGTALGPQLGQRGGVALAAGGEHEAEHEQHHQQRVEDPAALLPVRRQLLDGQRQRVRGQMLDPHPRKQQVARLPHHQVQVLFVGPRGPADPGVAAGQRVGRLAEQQAAQRPPLPVQQEVAQVRAHRLTVAEVMVPLDVLVPQPGLLLLLDQLQAQRLQLPQTRLDQGIHERICTPASYHRKSGLGCQGVFAESSKKTVSVSESAYWRILRKPRFRLA